MNMTPSPTPCAAERMLRSLANACRKRRWGAFPGRRARRLAERAALAQCGLRSTGDVARHLDRLASTILGERADGQADRIERAAKDALNLLERMSARRTITAPLAFEQP